MPVEYAFLKNPTLYYVRFYGHVSLDETLAGAQKFAQEPEFRHGQTHFFDLRDVTSFEHNFPKFFAMQAQIAEIYPERYGEQLNVFCAPPGPAAEMAEMARRTWEGSTAIVIRVAETWDQAFDILGGQRTDLVPQT